MDYEKLYKKALRFADKKEMGDEREDFAQECLIKAFEKGLINLEYIFLNYRDQFRTDKRILSAPQGKFSAHGIISLDAPLNREDRDSAKLGDVIGCSQRELECFGEDVFIIECLYGFLERVPKEAQDWAAIVYKKWLMENVF